MTFQQDTSTKPPFIQQIRLDGFLSFAPGSAAIELKPLNVLIGPNGSGKSNLIEAFELLHAAPVNLADLIRTGGGVEDWLWKGAEDQRKPARIAAVVHGNPYSQMNRPVRYQVDFTSSYGRLEVTDEYIEDVIAPFGFTVDELADPDSKEYYYKFNAGRPIINVRDPAVTTGQRILRVLERGDIIPDQSILSQRKDKDYYPELSWLGREFERIQTMREWRFGRFASIRAPQDPGLPVDRLLPGNENLGLVLNDIINRDHQGRFDEIMRRFLPRYKRLTIKPDGSRAMFYLQEDGMSVPIPSARLSDGTLRFMGILAALLAPKPPSLLCLEEPELGMHPDAVSLLAELLVEASSRMQLIVTTHSEALLTALNDHVDSVLVCENHGNGTVASRLDAERLADWLKDYSLGEIWRIGELGGNP